MADLQGTMDQATKYLRMLNKTVNNLGIKHLSIGMLLAGLSGLYYGAKGARILWFLTGMILCGSACRAASKQGVLQNITPGLKAQVGLLTVAAGVIGGTLFALLGHGVLFIFGSIGGGLLAIPAMNNIRGLDGNKLDIPDEVRIAGCTLLALLCGVMGFSSPDFFLRLLTPWFGALVFTLGLGLCVEQVAATGGVQLPWPFPLTKTMSFFETIEMSD